MIDHRVQTFLLLCDLMSYRKTAEALNISQPAVTQQIHFLEREYGCKLFEYRNHRLTKTNAAMTLERYARAMRCNDQQIRQRLREGSIRELRIGATKTIGDHVIGEQVRRFLSCTEDALTLIVDNTENLLRMLDDNQLDFAIVEGFFDRKLYDSYCLRREPFVGICRKGHPFAGRDISVAELLEETILHREAGSGTRAILEQKLRGYNESLSQFRRHICISSFKLLLELVKSGLGVSFVYNVLADSDPGLEKFRIQGEEIVREFNLVWLKNAHVRDTMEAFFCPEGK